MKKTIEENIEATVKSIKHWNDVVVDTGTRVGTDHCALCVLHSYANGLPVCDGCPLDDQGDKCSQLKGSPYTRYLSDRKPQTAQAMVDALTKALTTLIVERDKPKPLPNIMLELSPEEALVVIDLVGNTYGSSTTRRRHANVVFRKLIGLEVQYSEDKDWDGGITFKETSQKGKGS